MMVISCIPYRLAYGRAIVTDDVFWLVAYFRNNFLQGILYGCTIPAFRNGDVNNDDVLFCDGRSGIYCRYSKCQQQFLTAYHHAFIYNQSILLILKECTRFLVNAKPQFLCPIADCRISRYLAKGITHKFIQDVEYLNNLP